MDKLENIRHFWEIQPTFADAYVQLPQDAGWPPQKRSANKQAMQPRRLLFTAVVYVVVFLWYCSKPASLL